MVFSSGTWRKKKGSAGVQCVATLRKRDKRGREVKCS